MLLNRAAKAKKKYIAEGADGGIADQLVFKEIVVPNSKLFINEFWFDIVAWIAASGEECASSAERNRRTNERTNDTLGRVHNTKLVRSDMDTCE